MEVQLEDIVNHRISMLSVLMKRHVFKILGERDLDITPDQWVVMYYLWQENGLSIGDIANRSKKDFANVTRIVEKLKRRGYVNKKKSEKDGRIYHVFILPKADEIKEEIQDCWQKASDAVLYGITLSEQQQLMTILCKMEKNVLKSLEG